MAARNTGFWDKRQLELSTFEKSWRKSSSDADYSCPGLDQGIEEEYADAIILAGPLVDGEIRQIGRSIYAKLCRGRLTGLVPKTNFYVNKYIFGKMLALMRGYGAEVVNEGKKILIFIRSQTVSHSVFSEVRLDGTFYLAKRI